MDMKLSYDMEKGITLVEIGDISILSEQIEDLLKARIIVVKGRECKEYIVNVQNDEAWVSLEGFGQFIHEINNMDSRLLYADIDKILDENTRNCLSKDAIEYSAIWYEIEEDLKDKVVSIRLYEENVESYNTDEDLEDIDEFYDMLGEKQFTNELNLNYVNYSSDDQGDNLCTYTGEFEGNVTISRLIELSESYCLADFNVDHKSLSFYAEGEKSIYVVVTVERSNCNIIADILTHSELSPINVGKTRLTPIEMQNYIRSGIYPQKFTLRNDLTIVM